MNQHLWLRGVALGLSVVATSCSGTPIGLVPSDAGSGTLAEGGPAGTAGTLPCDVDAVLASRCRTCHGNPTQFSAPMPLVTYADLHAATPSKASVPVYQTVEARTHDAARPMPQPPNAPLSAADQATIDAWVQAGAPSGSGAACSPVPPAGDAGGTGSPDSGDDAGPPDDCVFDTHIAPASPFTLIGQEVYACYGFDIPTAGKRHVTQVKVRIDNSRIVHHVLLLESPTSTSGVPAVCSPGPTLSAPMMYAWAPGGNPLIVPPEAGFPQDQTTHYIVQVHYSNAANVTNTSDSTGFDLCTTANLRKYDADVVAFGTELIAIPPLAAATATTCYTIPSSFDGRTFFSAFPHMHELGFSIDTSLRSDAGTTDMGTIANWDFQNQPWLPIAATTHLGDVVRASCTWHNSGPGLVTFGQNTTDEMCFSFSAYYPKSDPAAGWSAPALGSVPCP